MLTGPAVMNGSAKGTALVVLVMGVPALAWALVRGCAGTTGLAVGLGAAAYLLYNAVMFAFATPFNRVFLLYVAMLGLGIAVVSLLVARAVATTSVPVPRRHRLVAGWIALSVLLNALAWLTRVVPSIWDDRPTSVLDGTGLTTNPVFVQDLAFWLPAFALVAWRLWRSDRRAVLPAAAGLVYWLLEGVGVAVDQAWGHLADPASDVASAAVVPMFAVLAVVNAVLLVVLLRDLGESTSQG
jgi:hypothetical protein